MTYCVGILVQSGVVLLADTRTNAGIDNISTFRKLHVYEKPGERAIALACAGNLSISQSVLSLVSEGVTSPDTGETERITDTPSMFRTAQLVGAAVRQMRRQYGEALEQAGLAFDVTFLLAGQIRGGQLRLYMIYAAGNFIECSRDTPFLQIGEHKYGKPILDRSVRWSTSLDDAIKLGLLSMDSTLRSNLSVGLPLDIAVIGRDALKIAVTHRIESGDPYFHGLSERWSSALRAAHMNIPPPPWGVGDAGKAPAAAPPDAALGQGRTARGR